MDLEVFVGGREHLRDGDASATANVEDSGVGREEGDCFLDAGFFEGVVLVGALVGDVESVEGLEAGERV